ncbi:zinc finger protein-like 1 homolog [Drosophila tropicalis]|uniref:zinc finger protein-like 1 homolog n=1 Tax=Drosophila tropicalis TaxID=46794 RepID=UPI0035AC11D6
MGLCKCPKRLVTNQFCFEHRVNVCEHCMVQSHPKCIVQSYLQWLRDSDYISNCTLCGTTLEQGECVRLVCYHVYHWDCLNARQAALPANTAPRGHQCPSCNVEIFPTSNLVSPVADALKNYLAQVNWGRNGLGLALLSEDHTSLKAARAINQAAVSNMTKVHHHSGGGERERAKPNGSGDAISPHSVLLMDAFNPPSSGDFNASSRRPLLPRQSPIGGTDRDDNKYQRRTPVEMFSRWTRRFYAPSSRPPWRRTWFLVVSGIMAFIIFIYLMAWLGRGGGGSNDGVDDAWNNPNPQPNHYE